MAYVFLGSGTTNSNGIAKLEKDAEGQSIDHSYTGTGAGEIDVVASLDNPITSGSVQSTTYTVIDGMMDSLLKEETPIYINGGHNNPTVTSTDEDIKITIADGQTGGYSYLKIPLTPTGKYKISAKMKTKSLGTDSYLEDMGFILANPSDDDYRSFYFRVDGNQANSITRYSKYTSEGNTHINMYNISKLSYDTFYLLECTVDGLNVTWSISDLSNNVVVSKSVTMASITVTDIGILVGWEGMEEHIKEVILSKVN